VIDPVIASHAGGLISFHGAPGSAVDYLFPLADLVTPNLPEPKRCRMAIKGRTISWKRRND